MRELPIPFQPSMVRAILREIEQPGTGKTQTRRIAEILEPSAPIVEMVRVASDKAGRSIYEMKDARGQHVWVRAGKHSILPQYSPRYAVGDRLWVREAWRTPQAYDDLAPSQMSGDEPIKYEADGALERWGWPELFLPGRYRHARFMPRWASRLTLIVTDVRVQRLQDISEEDAIAEGIRFEAPTAEDCAGWRSFAEENGLDPDQPMDGVWLADGTRSTWGLMKSAREKPVWGPTAKSAYQFLWDQINGAGAWEANPWVAAYTFEPRLGNIDCIEAGGERAELGSRPLHAGGV